MPSLLDKHDPLQRKVMVIQSKLPWYTKLNVGNWKVLLTGLPEDKMAYCNTPDEYTRLLSDTNMKYYADLIEESAGDTIKEVSTFYRLFKVVISLWQLTSQQVSAPLVPPLLTISLLIILIKQWPVET